MPKAKAKPKSPADLAKAPSEAPQESASERADNVTKRALAGVRVQIIGGENVSKRFDGKKAEPGQTKTAVEDPFESLAAEGNIVIPPFDLLTLAMLPEHSSELYQCVEAMEINIDGLGHRQIPRVTLDDSAKEQMEDAMKKEVAVERARLINFFEYCTQESFTQWRRRLRKDVETTGNGYFEIIRDASGQVQQFVHVAAYQMRLAREDREATKYNRPILKMGVNGEVTVDTVEEYKRFRRFIQGKKFSRRTGTESMGFGRRWFKEFNDPRDVHQDTGEYGTKEKPVPPDKRANEMIHISLYSARTPYGLPRFIGNLLSIYGDRASEEINYTTFRNNNIPSMIIMVANGQLTAGSIDRLTSFTESQIQGSDNYSKMVIVEAESTADEGEDGGQVKLDIKPLVSEQHTDALFQGYSKNNQDKIRRSFRLPPIFVGKADDYTRATAEASRKLADEQVFGPERDVFDSIMNRIIYPTMGIRYHKFKTNTPNTTDNEALVKILAGAEKTGGMTPRIARRVLEGVMNEQLGGFPEGFDADVPFSVTMAKAVKNMADPTEPGQQVTAIKRMRALFDALDIPVESDDAMVSFIKSVHEQIEDGWRGATAESATPVEKSNVPSR
jgi:PBSX family phage portal protein